MVGADLPWFDVVVETEHPDEMSGTGPGFCSKVHQTCLEKSSSVLGSQRLDSEKWFFTFIENVTSLIFIEIVYPELVLSSALSFTKTINVLFVLAEGTNINRNIF